MEEFKTPPEDPSLNISSTVDTSRPFRSVKEAVAIFGERLLLGEVCSPKPYMNVVSKQETSWMALPSPIKTKEVKGNTIFDTVKKLEAELEETKVELKLLKERESDTEVALASLNAELHNNMSKLAEAEAAKVGVRSEEDQKKREMMKRIRKDSPTLAQILSIGNKGVGGYYGGKKEKKVLKKKPIIPLVGDLFSTKKGSSKSSTLYNPLYSSPQLYN